MNRYILAILTICCFISTGAAFATDHPLITEFCVTPTAGEFIEIVNPTESTIDLTNYYLADYIYSNDNDYINLVDDTDSPYYQDFLAKFPDGATIDPGEFQVVSIDDNDEFFVEYGVEPDYELVDDDIGDLIPNMVDPGEGIDRIGSSAGLSNAGESVMMFFWDGTTDLVFDVDYIVWGDKAEAIDKTGEKKDGPDVDADSTAYLPDTPVENQTVVNCDGGSEQPHSSGNTAQRIDPYVEGPETQTGGNGITGHDETSEDMSLEGGSWILNGAPTPGEPPFSAPPPEVFGVGYMPCIPGDSEDVTVKAYVLAEGGIDYVKLFYSVNEGTDWLEVTMTNIPPDSLFTGVIPGQAAGERVWYYVECLDQLGQIVTNPFDGSYKFQVETIIPLVTIQSDTTGAAEPGDSNFQGLPVNVEGTVIAGSGTFNDYTFYIAGDAENPSEWDGMHVYSYFGNPPVSVGDRVRIAGLVEEYYNETEVNANNSYADTTNCIEIIGSGVVNPLLVNTGNVPGAESLESVLVTTENATIVDILDYGEWVINDGTGDCVVDDWSGYMFEPEIGKVVSVTGIVHYSYGVFKIEPRDDADIVEETEPAVTIAVSSIPTEVAKGELATWRVDLTNNTGDVQVVDVWLSITSDVLPPPWNPYIKVLVQNISLPPNWSGGGWAKVPVPMNAPVGTYSIENIVGEYPANPWDSVSFDVDVVAP